MSLSLSVRRWAAALLAIFAAVELITATVVVCFGGFSATVGPIRITGGSAVKAAATAVFAAAAAWWLIEPLQRASTRSTAARYLSFVAAGTIIAGLVPLLAPYFRTNFLFGHDGGVHQTYAYLFDRAIRQGQLPVRWVEGLGYGLGQPLFNFYQVGFYYLVELIHRTGPPLSVSVKVAIAFAWASGTSFVFFWLRPLGRLPGLLGASIFCWTPYLMLNGYVRTAYPELMAICVAPAVFWSLGGVLRTGRVAYCSALAAATAVLLVTHLPASLIIAPVAAAYLVAVVANGEADRRGLPLAAAAVTLGVGLAAFYIAPAILERDEVQMQALVSDYFDYHQHFVRPGSWFDWSWGYGPSASGQADEMSKQIGIAQWFVIVAAIGAMAALIWRRDSRWRVLAGWLGVVLFSLFMMTAASAGVWNRIPPLAFIQFPWRFLMLPVLACSALSAYLLALVPCRSRQALIVIAAVALQWSMTRNYWLQALDRPRARIAIDVPGWAFSPNAREWGFREARYNPRRVTSQVSGVGGRWSVASGSSRDVTPLLMTDTRLDFRIDAGAPLDLIVNTPFFPGWQMSLDGREMNPSILPGSSYMQVTVPPGSHQVQAKLGDTGLRRLANATTLAGAIVWLTIIAVATARRPRTTGLEAGSSEGRSE